EEDLRFRNLSADLFTPSATGMIDEVKLSNEGLHRVLDNLLLSEVKAGQDRGFISYATLGVTELGQVYEGLMSYTGFIAKQDLWEVAPNGDPSKGSWVVTAEQAQALRDDDKVDDCFVTDLVVNEHGGSERRERKHPQGSFVYRQSSRDRERSASFYTPQVITEFTVAQAIEELKYAGRIEQAQDILTLTICEPAMGSGAFAVEAVRQLSELYLEMRQQELGDVIDAADRSEELQKVKAYIALHQVYGVDLNATAVELAEISLWLDTMTKDLKAPWFGLHLRRGNSLFGASHSFYSLHDLKQKDRWSLPPTPAPLPDLAKAHDEGSEYFTQGVYHFLVPATGWGAAADVKEAKKFSPEQRKKIADWRRPMMNWPKIPARSNENATTGDWYKLKSLSSRVDVLFKFALLRMREANRQTMRHIDVYGHEYDYTPGAVTRKDVEHYLHRNPDSAYARLKLVMDLWCALWFWPLTEDKTTIDGENIEPPTSAQWYDALVRILGSTAAKASVPGQLDFASLETWEDLDLNEQAACDFAGADTLANIRHKHPWIRVCDTITEQQGFFHWELEYAHIFADGGFDLQIGNPPWVRPRTDVDELWAETDPWWALAHKPTQAAKRRQEEFTAQQPCATDKVLDGLTETAVLAQLLRSHAQYPQLKGQQPDLYRGFICRTWQHTSPTGVVSLIHPESHLAEKKAVSLRRECYARLRRHWQFSNELSLFQIGHAKTYGISIYGAHQTEPSFLQASSLYHPQTITDSLIHDGTGPLPGLKDDDDNWDRRPHADRIQHIDMETLSVWRDIVETPGTPPIETRIVYTVNTDAARVLEQLAHQPRAASLYPQFSRGWDETNDKKKGFFDVGWSTPDSWADVIMQGPHVGISCPMIKQPNKTLNSKGDWTKIDFEAIADDFIPATGYVPTTDTKKYDANYGTWTIGEKPVPMRSAYRIAWREMGGTTAFRTLFPSIIPPNAAHVHAVHSACCIDSDKKPAAKNSATALLGACLSSLLVDHLVRSTCTGHTPGSVVVGLPVISPTDSQMVDSLIGRYLKLNCLTKAYAPLWEEITGTPWTVDTPVRNPLARQRIQNEIDALVAIGFGVSVDDLCMIYRTQFPVMRKYDSQNLFDANGRLVPKEVLELEKKKPGSLSVEERTWAHPQSGVDYTFKYPFTIHDREADMREAYERFMRELR
ncbi:Eco57I restriction-modification methylase domain-containing protein, partial [Corynebacterium mendelii]